MSDSGKNQNSIAIGMGGWEIPSFDGVFYPAKSEKDFRKLEYYSRFFDLIEVNATFYTVSLSPAQARRWLSDVGGNPAFSFAVKLFRGFTHTFNGTKEDVLAVHRLLDPLRVAGKLDGVVAQFSSSFGRSGEREKYLKKLKSLFQDDRVFFDIRHRSWDDEEFYRFCADNGLLLINVDLPQLPNHMPLNEMAREGTAYFRMMGRNAQDWNDFKSGKRYLYNYSEEELAEIVVRIKQLNAKNAYIVFHNDVQAYSLANGKQLEHALFPQKRLKAPMNLIAAFPQLKSFCKDASPGHDLFSSSQPEKTVPEEHRPEQENP